MGKITKATNDSKARENALVELGLNDKFLKVGNNSYGIEVSNEEGKTVVARIDIVIPKLDEGVTLADLEAEYLDMVEIKEQNALLKEQAKAKKITRDTKQRAKAKEEKGE